MLFRDTKQGYPIYMFNRKDISVKIGNVTNVSIPHFDPKGAIGKMVVDVDIDVDGNVTSYVLNDTDEVGYSGDMVISADKECILREVTRQMKQSEDALKMMSYHEDAKRKCEELMKEFSSEYKERSESTERMTALESKVDKLTESLASMMEIMKERSKT